MFQEALGRVSGGEDLSLEEMADVIDIVMQGSCRDEEIGLLLTALRAKGETVPEIAGAAMAMRRHMTPIRSEREGLIDTCGTGGDGSGTFNISTAAALVAAATGAPVAKHGNRKITSKSGSADVLTELGVNIEASVEIVERCLNELGICFCFAPQLHPAMKHVAAVRRQLGVPTIFNLLGPLSNPAAAPFQLLGVGKPELRTLLAAALSHLPVESAVVVCGDEGLDEVSLATSTSVSHVAGDQIREFKWQPGDFGLPSAGHESMRAETPAESAAVIRDVLAGTTGPSRDIVVLNAAAALWSRDPSTAPEEYAAQTAEAIDSGSAGKLLASLARVSHLT